MANWAEVDAMTLPNASRPEDQLSRVSTQPTGQELVLWAGLLLTICVLFAHFAGGLWVTVERHGDNASYAMISRAIRTRDFGQVTQVKHFWGLSYTTAGVAALVGISEPKAIFVVSLTASLLATVLVWRLWGSWVALFFVAGNWTWLEFSAYGGSESLFAALVFAALLAARHERWRLASVLAACGTVVRPLGIFAVIAILIVLWRRRARRATAITGILVLLIFAIYSLPLLLHFHDPLANFHGYQRQDWFDQWPITVPLRAVVANFINGRNVGNFFIKYAKSLYLLLHIVAVLGILVSQPIRARLLQNSLEATFALSYSAFILTYNSPIWALSIYPRLLIPIFPILLWTYERWLPKRRWTITVLGLISVLMGAGAGIGLQNSLQLLRVVKGKL